MKLDWTPTFLLPVYDIKYLENHQNVILREDLLCVFVFCLWHCLQVLYNDKKYTGTEPYPYRLTVMKPCSLWHDQKLKTKKWIQDNTGNKHIINTLYWISLSIYDFVGACPPPGQTLAFLKLKSSIFRGKLWPQNAPCSPTNEKHLQTKLDWALLD